MVICQFKCLAGLAKVKRRTFSRKIVGILMPQICEQVSLSKNFPVTSIFIFSSIFWAKSLAPEWTDVISAGRAEESDP